MAPSSPSASPSTREDLRAGLESYPLDERGDGFHEVEFRALGSACQLFFEADGRARAEAFREVAFDWLAGFEARFSSFLPDSFIARLNDAAGKHWLQTDAETELMLDLCAHAHFITRGAFDATSLPLSLLWNWRAKRDRLPSAEEIDAAKGMVDWRAVCRRRGEVFLPRAGMMLDFGGVGKEFAVDCLRQIALGMGIANVMVDLGGDIAVAGEPPEGGGWYVGLEDPAQSNATFCGVRLRGGTAVATSGDYRRFFHLNGSRYGHIIDSRTGWPVANGTVAVTVLAKRCVTAGLLSTAALLLGGDEATRIIDSTAGAEGCLWHRGLLHESRRFRRSLLPDGWDADEDVATDQLSNLR